MINNPKIKKINYLLKKNKKGLTALKVKKITNWSYSTIYRLLKKYRFNYYRKKKANNKPVKYYYYE